MELFPEFSLLLKYPTWYETLNKPSFNPPNWVFGPVWTTLYFLMGISLFLIWKQLPGRERNRAILVFMIQLFLNFCWSFLFFYFHQLGLALVEILLLWLSIFADDPAFLQAQAPGSVYQYSVYFMGYFCHGPQCSLLFFKQGLNRFYQPNTISMNQNATDDKQVVLAQLFFFIFARLFWFFRRFVAWRNNSDFI